MKEGAAAAAEEGVAEQAATKGRRELEGRGLEVVPALAFPCLYKYDGMFFLIFKLRHKTAAPAAGAHGGAEEKAGSSGGRRRKHASSGGAQGS